MLFVFVTYLNWAISLHIIWSFYAIEYALMMHFLVRKVIVKCYHFPIHPKPKSIGLFAKKFQFIFGKIFHILEK